ncbi:MAG: AAA family ATPase [Anaerolineae bacterium]|nr:AAA family ATPase [Anaerolineae bacterium]
MALLRVQLFKNLVVQSGAGELLDMGSPTTRALFAYLVLHGEAETDRRRLAFLFWPRGTEAAARRNLRQYLHRLRRALEPVDPEGGLIDTTGNCVRFHTPARWWLDVAAFEGAVATGDLATAVDLYRGELLPEVYDDWIVPERDRLAHLHRQAMLELTERMAAAQQWQEAIGYAQRFLTLEPLLESAHVRLMRLYYATGNRMRVKEQYAALRHALVEELDTEPLPETVEAYEAMMAGTYDVGELRLTGAAATAMMPPPGPHGVTREAPQQDEPRLVGRAAEIDWLDEALAGAAAGQGAVYFIQGESGVGKTRLVQEWVSRIEAPSFFFAGRGHEFEMMLPYGPVAEALRRAAADGLIPWQQFQPPPTWLASLQVLLPDLYDYFPDLEGARQQVGGQHHVVEGLGNFLAALATSRPVILFLDNLHWADLPTWNFIGYLAPRAVATRLLVVVTLRLEDTPADRLALLHTLQRKGWVQERALPRLSRQETAALVRDLVPDVDPRFVERVYAETEGNPFFIIETIRAVREAGGDWTEKLRDDRFRPGPELPIPERVKEVVQSRLDKLDEQSRLALCVAAAIGREFTFDVLQEVSQYSTVELLNALDEWVARGLVRETKDGYDFTHEKLSQVAYEGLTRARRRWVHGRIATFLEANVPESDPAKLASHYFLSNEAERALPYLVRAGDRALSTRSYAEAREFGLRAIGLLGRFPRLKQTQQTERIDLNLQLAQAHAFTGALPQALQLLQETEHLAETLGDIWRLARVFQRSAQIFWLRGHGAEAADYARRVLRHAEELDDHELRIAALRMLGRTHILLGRYDDAIAYLLRYSDLAEQMGAPADLPVIYGYLGVAYGRVGSWQRAIDAGQRGVELAADKLTGAMHAVARMQLAFIHSELHEWDQVLQVTAPVRGAWQEEGMSPHAFMLRAVVGRALVHRGQRDEGLAEIQSALQWAQEVDHRLLVHVAYLRLAQCQSHAGKHRAAQQTAQQAEVLAAKAGDPWAEAVAWRTNAEAAMRLARPDWPQIEGQLIRARDQLRRLRTRPDLARTYLVMRRLYDRAGQVAWAVDCHFRATTIFDELGMLDELREAQGRPAGERRGAVVLPGLQLRGPNVSLEEATGLT